MPNTEINNTDNVIQDNLAETKKLDTILKINNEPYKIVAAETEKVKNPLVINYHNINGNDKLDFDGSNQVALDVVSARTGGFFKGEIKVPSIDANEIDAYTVLNYSDIKNKVLRMLSNTSGFYRWSKSAETNEAGEELLVLNSSSFTKPEIGGISVVLGKFDDMEDFRKANQYTAIKDTSITGELKYKQIEYPLTSVFYICTDTEPYKMYFGTLFNAGTEMQMYEISNTADFYGIKFNIDFRETQTTFDPDAKDQDGNTYKKITIGSKDVIVPIENGGTGANNADEACRNIGALCLDPEINDESQIINGKILVNNCEKLTFKPEGANDTDKIVLSMSDDSELNINYNNQNLVQLSANKLAVQPSLELAKPLDIKSGGTGEIDLMNVKVGNAVKDGIGNTIAEYYQAKIFYGTVDPTELANNTTLPIGTFYVQYEE